MSAKLGTRDARTVTDAQASRRFCTGLRRFDSVPFAARVLGVTTTMLGMTVLVLGSCATLAPPPELTPAVVEVGARLGFTRSELEHGRVVFTQSCGRCHSRPDPRVIPTEGWDVVLDRMAEKARSAPVDRTAVRAYVQACANLGH